MATPSKISVLRTRGVAMMKNVFSPQTANNVEKSIANHTVALCLNIKKKWLQNELEKHYQAIYARKIRSISFNACKYDAFRTSVENHDISFDAIPQLFHDQMCENGPHSIMKYKLAKKALKLEGMHKYMEEFFEHSFSSSDYTCKECNASHTVMRHEEKANYDCVLCLTCGSRWKE